MPPNVRSKDHVPKMSSDNGLIYSCPCRPSSSSRKTLNHQQVADTSGDFVEASLSAVLIGALVILFLFRRRRAQSFTLPRLRGHPEPFNSLPEVQDAIRKEGLESCELIFAIDFTKSNTWNGKHTFGGRCLHAIQDQQDNPYQRVMRVIARTLEAFDDDRMIPVFGFGDLLTKGTRCFPFYPDRPCLGFEDVLARYNYIVPSIELSGPTNFAPVIRKATEIVRDTKSFHLLVIIADGQVTSERETIEAIVDASNYPLAILCIGVGDGPWEQMQAFDDRVPRRRFDNFQVFSPSDTISIGCLPTHNNSSFSTAISLPQFQAGLHLAPLPL